MNHLKKRQGNKLLNRFNTSITMNQQSEPLNRINNSKDHSQNHLRYRNHIQFLESRLQQQQITIEKLNQDLSVTQLVENKLKNYIGKLQTENKKINYELQDVKNKANELDFHYNNLKVSASIEKMEMQLTLNKNKKPIKINQSTQNPQKSTNRSTKYLQKSSRESASISSMRDSMIHQKIILSPQLYQISIKPSTGSQAVKNDDQSNQLRIKKLQEAIYFLKKQLKQKCQSYEQQIKMIQSIHIKQIQKLSAAQRMAHTTNFEERIIELQDKINEKDKQILDIELKYSKELSEAEQIVLSLNQQIQFIANNKQQQNAQPLLCVSQQQDQIKIVQLINKNQQLEKLVLAKQAVLSDTITTMRKMQEQVVNIEKQREKMREQTNEIERLTQKLLMSENKLKNLVEQFEKFQIKRIENEKSIQIQEKHRKQIGQMKVELDKKVNLIHEQQSKYEKLSSKVKSLQENYEKLNKNSNFLSSDLQQTRKQVFDLEELKQDQLQQINKLNNSIRHFEGEVAQKQYLMTSMAEQMMAIKDKLSIERSQAEVQYEPNTDQQEETQQEPLNAEELQEHFAQILKQKQEQYDQLAIEVQKQKGKCEQLQKQLQKYMKEAENSEQQLKQLKQKLEEMTEIVSRYQSQLEQNKMEIKSLKKTIAELQEKSAFLEDYIAKIKQENS